MGFFDGIDYCTVLKDGEFHSCDTVPSDHHHGLSADGRYLHIKGIHLPDDRTVAFGLARGSMTDPYAPLTPCGHGPAVADAQM